MNKVLKQVLEELNMGKSEYNEWEENREMEIGHWLKEVVDYHIVPLMLRLKYGWIHHEPFFLTKHGQVELYYKKKDKEPTLHVAYIGVNEEFRRQGLGSEYLQVLREVAEKYGYKILQELNPKFSISEEGLIEFYEKNGFKLIEKNNKSMEFKVNKIEEV